MANRVGQQLGNYRLTQLLGTGGFADVYLGEHVYLKTFAAIKVLHTRLAQNDLEGFLSEARTIAALKHPHIVRVLEFGVEGGTPYLVMDYAPGGTLRERLPEGTPLSPTAILPIVQQVADALQYAHEQRLIHRDVKPENMLLDERRQVMLSDFGIATIAQSSRYQQTEGVAGTAAYMAPEQLRGRPRPASDQYALGIVVYEWLTGERPFQGAFAEVASQHLFVPPPPLSEKVPAISPTVEQVVLRALAKDSNERFASMQDFADAFEQASQGRQSTRLRPTSALPPTLPAAAPPVTTPRNRSAWGEPTPAGKSPATSGPFLPTPRVPPHPVEPAPRMRRTEPPLPTTVRAAPPSRGPTPAPERSRARPWWVGGLLVALVVLLVFVLMSRSPSSPASSGAPANGAAPTTTMILTATAAPTAAPPGTVLYSADWSNGMNGWTGPAQWSALNGMLVSTGDNNNNLDIDHTTVFAPYQPGTPNYAVEATIRIVACPEVPGCYGGLGLVTRLTLDQSGDASGWIFGIDSTGGLAPYPGVAEVYPAENVGGSSYVCNCSVSSQPYTPGTGWHTYRAEVQGNDLKLLIDGTVVFEATDNRYLSPGRIGIMGFEMQLNVSSFTVIAL